MIAVGFMVLTASKKLCTSPGLSWTKASWLPSVFCGLPWSFTHRRELIRIYH